METDASTQNFLTVLSVVLAGVIGISSSEGPFTYWNVIIGAVLSLVLLNYTVSPNTSEQELLALAVTWGFTIISGTGLLFQELYRWVRFSFWKSLPDFLENGEAPKANSFTSPL